MQTVIYDPTAADAASSVRGIGRYLQLLRENLSDAATFTSSLKTIQRNSVLVNPFFNVTQPPRIRKRLAKKQIAVIHDLIPLSYPHDFPLGFKGKLNVMLNKYLLRRYDKIVTDSEASRDEIISIFKVPKEKIAVIYPCLPKSFLEPVNKPKKDVILNSFQDLTKKPYFIYVGDATANKNLIMLAKAVKEIDTTVIFVGKVFTNPRTEHPWNKHLNEFMKVAEGDERFVFPGFVPDAKLRYLYSHAIANILVSQTEGFGFSFLEAASCKTPSLLADTPIFHETAQDSALFATPGVEQIATSLLLLASEKKLRAELAEKAYQRSKFFSAEKFKKEWKTILT